MTTPFAPQDSEPLSHAAGWLVTLITGELSLPLCTLAVAFIGFMILRGRLELRRSAAVVLGCFVLLGAPTIAGAFLRFGEAAARSAGSGSNADANLGDRSPVPPADYDPYAGASMRDDR